LQVCRWAEFPQALSGLGAIRQLTSPK